MIKVLSYIFPEITVAQKSERNAKHVAIILLYAVALSLSFLVINKLNIEPSSGIVELAWFIVPGFVIASLTVERYKAFIYTLLFFVCAFYAFGIFSAALLILVLILFACLLYIQFNWVLKFISIAFLLATLLLLRINIFYLPRLNLIIPFALSVLMFRALLLMYEFRYSKPTGNYWVNIAYLFSFPNLTFLLGLS